MMQRMFARPRRRVALAIRQTLLAALSLSACGPADETSRRPVLETLLLPVEAICEAQVDGSGQVEVETDYLPHVVACENGGADFAALQAQAVAARSYLYYKIRSAGHIGDGQGDQVYTCGRGPNQAHLDAAASTAGQVLMYHDDVIAAFYVAGAIPSTDDCRPAPGDRDPTGTEHFVTYNEGRSGDALEQTSLGFVNPRNYANRGCKSQNGANCLSEHGVPYDRILRFYYGEDIELVNAEGPCAGPPPPPPPPPPACEQHVTDTELLVDDQDPCFEKQCAPGSNWYEVNAGERDHSYMTYTDATAEPACDGRWRFGVDRAGEYEVAVRIEDYGPPLSRSATYTVRHDGAEDRVTVDLEGQHGWVVLGTWPFAAGGPDAQWVYLPDNTGEAWVDENGPRLLYDAIRVRPALPAPPDAPSETPIPTADTGPSPPPEMDALGGSDFDADPSGPGSPSGDERPSTPEGPTPGNDAGEPAGRAPGVSQSVTPRDAEFNGGCQQTPGAPLLWIFLPIWLRKPSRRRGT